jgi:hypothetical protein
MYTVNYNSSAKKDLKEYLITCIRAIYPVQDYILSILSKKPYIMMDFGINNH